MPTKKLALPAVLAALLAACATADIVPMGTDTYMISQTSAGGVFKSMSSLKADVMKRANAFAQSKGKIAIPVASKETPVRPGRNMPNFEYQFRLVDRDDPRASGDALVPRADVVIENRVHPVPLTNAKDEPKSQDIYTELLRLDDLRKRNIITESEFEAQKQKLLAGK